MEIKRVLLATALSLAVLLGYQYFFPQTAPKQAPAPVAEQAAPASEATSAAPASEGASVVGASGFAAKGKRITVATPLYTAEFVTQGGVLEHFTLAKYKQGIEDGSPNVDLITPAALDKAPMGVIWNGAPTWNTGEWSVQGGDLTLGEGQSGSITFICDLPDVRLERVLSFSAGSYLIGEELRVANKGSKPAHGRLDFTLASSALTKKDDSYNRTRVEYYGAKGFTQEEDLGDLATEGLSGSDGIRWGAVASNYFLLAIVPDVEGVSFKSKLVDDIFRMAMEKDGIVVDPGTASAYKTDYYIGPKEPKQLAAAPGNLAEALHYGFFNFISKPLLLLLNWFYQYVGNYGVAIILLTVVIKAVFWPLSKKSYESMNRMKKLQPMMAKLREKYGDDRQRLNQELMQLYKTYKVNPAGGCLPMVLQIPVFFGLYQALLGAIELRHAPFIPHLPFTDMVWLADLSAKDPYYITPLIMGGTMFLQQLMTPAAGDPTQAKIMKFMPVIFTFFFLNFPSGLVVYWMINNILSITQQWLLMRKAS